MTTMEALKWAFEIKNASPEERLVAIYIATIVNQDGVAVVDLAEAAKWCGFISSARHIPRLQDVRGAIQSLPNIKYDYFDACALIVMEDGK